MDIGASIFFTEYSISPADLEYSVKKIEYSVKKIEAPMSILYLARRPRDSARRARFRLALGGRALAHSRDPPL